MLHHANCEAILLNDKHELLRNILRNNLTLLNGISNDMLTNRNLTESDIKLRYFNCIRYLISSTFGIEILCNIVMQNPWIVDEKVADIVFEKLSRPDNPDRAQYFKALYVHMDTPVGIYLLCALITLYPAVLLTLDTGSLKALLEGNIPADKRLSLLVSLSAQLKGRLVLSKIIEKYPEFSSLIKPIIWDTPHESLPYDACYPDTPFTFNFNPSMDGENLIEPCRDHRLTTSNLEALFEHPNAESLLFDTRNGVNLFRELVIKHLFEAKDIATATRNFQPFLELLTKKPEYTRIFTKERLESRFINTESSRASNLCVLLYFGQEMGTKILALILKHNPNISETLSLDALTRVYPEFKDSRSTPFSPLSRLLESGLGNNHVTIDILNMLLHHHLLNQTIPIDIPRILIEGLSFCKTAFLSNNTKQHEFLFNIFRDPNAIKLLTPELLLTHMSYDMHQRTVLQALTSTTVGRMQFLPHILQHNMTIAAAITFTHLTEPYECIDEKNLTGGEKTNLITFLSTQEGHFLDLLYEQNPKLRERISVNQTMFQPASAAITAALGIPTTIGSCTEIRGASLK